LTEGDRIALKEDSQMATTVAAPGGGSYTVPSHLTAPELGKVNVSAGDGVLKVDFTVLMEPQGKDAEGWQTGVAIDASASMKEWFGRRLLGKVPPPLMNDYKQKGWLRDLEIDGKKVQVLEKKAHEDAIAKGHLTFSLNTIEPLAQEFISYLAGNLDADGGTTVIYWACGDGSRFEEVGDFTEEQCKTLAVRGPASGAFGAGTILTPAIHYFCERFKDAARGMYIFITDGRIDDLDRVKDYSRKLANLIAANKRNSVKFVLVGVGNEIDEKQMIELDNLETGTEVDLWDHKIAKEMRSLIEIFAEVVDENQIVAPTATVYDSSGRAVRVIADGLTTKTSVALPLGTPWFELDVAGKRIRQTLAQA
jgi:hypothetical protein